MRTFACLLLSLLVGSCCLLTYGQIPRRQVTKTLTLSNGIDWGTLGKLEYCPDGSWAVNFEGKFEPYTFLDTDETGFNALRLYCFTKDNSLTGFITSTEGDKGEWQDMRSCHNGFLTAMRARVLPPQGALADDVAVQNMQLECDYGREILTAVDGAYAKIPLGEWGEWSACPKDSAICGIQTQYNKPTTAVDDAGVCDMLLFCCSLNETTTVTS
ncbi:vitelline membrane outer layer protein 1 homolog [Portunus trituberculatus]|uniref:vitelline membrane outer layer protein 1 homolog n=1 Tax=Portunus trituberculatus TaxID=210409 RepID=UPI001E1CB257|nr:vitelline membrane outer layer protein 1 homolog [Portunus trituberculatus]